MNNDVQEDQIASAYIDDTEDVAAAKVLMIMRMIVAAMILMTITIMRVIMNKEFLKMVILVNSIYREYALDWLEKISAHIKPPTTHLTLRMLLMKTMTICELSRLLSMQRLKRPSLVGLQQNRQ